MVSFGFSSNSGSPACACLILIPSNDISSVDLASMPALPASASISTTPKPRLSATFLSRVPAGNMF